MQVQYANGTGSILRVSKFDYIKKGGGSIKTDKNKAPNYAVAILNFWEALSRLNFFVAWSVFIDRIQEVDNLRDAFYVYQ